MTWDELKQRRARVGDHVVHRALAQETILLNVRTSTYHTMDEIGGRFFETIRNAPTLDAACAELAAEYEQPYERIAADLTAFCAQLVERDLVGFDVAVSTPANRRS